MTRCLLLGWVRWVLIALAIIQTVLFHLNFHNRDKEGTFPEFMELLWMKQEVRASLNSTISSTTSSERSKDDVPVVAYATTISKCGVVPQKYNESNSPWKDIFALQDAAAVFAHSIHLASYPRHPTARYRSKLYAFIPTKNTTTEKGMKPCIQALSNAGFTVLLRDLPVENPMSHLTREFPVLKKRFPDKPWKWKPRKLIGKDGCCGQNELLKLRMFELVDHPVAVHLDLDSLILAPLDDLFDVIVHNNSSVARRRIVEKGYIAPTYNNPHQNSNSNNNGILPQRIDAFYTKDWNMAKHDLKVGVQGGFLVARPDLAVYKQLQEIIETGNYVIKGDDRKKQGWGGMGYGGQIEGSMTFQGLMAYYYGEISHDTAVELHRCRFNQMADNPRQTVGFPRVRPTPLNSTMATKLGWSDGNCKDGRHDCHDVQCQTWPMTETLSIHFTHCLKPWTCPNPEEKWGGTMAQAACEALHHEWFRVRADLEERGSIDDSFGIEPVNATGTFYSGVFGGYCGNATTDLGYVKMRYKAGRDS